MHDEKNKPGSSRPGSKSETADGQPPGAHAPSSMGTGGISERDESAPQTSGNPPPEGHVEDPKASPKEQAQRAAETSTVGSSRQLGDMGPVAKGMQRVRVTSQVTVNGQMYPAGSVVDLSPEDAQSLKDHVEKV